MASHELLRRSWPTTTGALGSRTDADVIATPRRFVDADGTSVACVAGDRRVIDVADRVLGWRAAAYTDAAEPLTLVTDHGVP